MCLKQFHSKLTENAWIKTDKLEHSISFKLLKTVPGAKINLCMYTHMFMYTHVFENKNIFAKQTETYLQVQNFISWLKYEAICSNNMGYVPSFNEEKIIKCLSTQCWVILCQILKPPQANGKFCSQTEPAFYRCHVFTMCWLKWIPCDFDLLLHTRSSSLGPLLKNVKTDILNVLNPHPISGRSSVIGLNGWLTCSPPKSFYL